MSEKRVIRNTWIGEIHRVELTTNIFLQLSEIIHFLLALQTVSDFISVHYVVSHPYARTHKPRECDRTQSGSNLNLPHLKFHRVLSLTPSLCVIDVMDISMLFFFIEYKPQDDPVFLEISNFFDTSTTL